jgi:hypothetical protein
MLLRLADRLCDGLGLGGEGRAPAHLGSRRARSDMLSPDDEALVATMRQALAAVAAAAVPAKREPRDDAVRAALDGAELVIRGELVSGNAERLPSLMPSFVFLVTLPIVDQDEALDLARRTAELVEDAR